MNSSLNSVILRVAIFVVAVLVGQIAVGAFNQVVDPAIKASLAVNAVNGGQVEAAALRAYVGAPQLIAFAGYTILAAALVFSFPRKSHP